MSSVPTIASAIPISPARTPWRAVRGWLNHFRDKINRAAATRYVPVPNQEFAAASKASPEAAPNMLIADRALVTFWLPTEHFEHSIGDPEAADNVCCRRDDAKRAQHIVERRVPFSHHLNARNDRDRGDRVRE